MCLETLENDYLLNEFGKLNSSMVNIELHYCENTCNSSREITNKFIYGKYIAISYIDHFIDAYDYK